MSGDTISAGSAIGSREPLHVLTSLFRHVFGSVTAALGNVLGSGRTLPEVDVSIEGLDDNHGLGRLDEWLHNRPSAPLSEGTSS